MLKLLLDGSLLKNICRPNCPHGICNTIALAWVWRQHLWKLNHHYNENLMIQVWEAQWQDMPSKRSPNRIQPNTLQNWQSLFKWWHPLIKTCILFNLWVWSEVTEYDYEYYPVSEIYLYTNNNFFKNVFLGAFLTLTLQTQIECPLWKEIPFP